MMMMTIKRQAGNNQKQSFTNIMALTFLLFCTSKSQKVTSFPSGHERVCSVCISDWEEMHEDRYFCTLKHEQLICNHRRLSLA